MAVYPSVVRLAFVAMARAPGPHAESLRIIGLSEVDIISSSKKKVFCMYPLDHPTTDVSNLLVIMSFSHGVHVGVLMWRSR